LSGAAVTAAKKSYLKRLAISDLEAHSDIEIDIVL